MGIFKANYKVAQLAIMVLAVINVQFLVPALNPGHQAPRGVSDFQIFKTAAVMLAEHKGSQLYDLPVQYRFNKDIVPEAPRNRIILPYNHLAYEALLFRPLANLPFATSYYVWMVFNFLIMVAIALICARIVGVPLSFAALFFFAQLAFFPTIFTLLQGQISILLLFVYVLAVYLLKERHDVAAGAVLALGLFKFHLVLPFVFALMLRRKWNFVMGFLAGAVPVLVVSVLVTGTAGVHDYFRLIAFFQGNAPEVFDRIAAMPNLRGFIMDYLGVVNPAVGRVLVLLATFTAITLLLRTKLSSDHDVAEDVYLALAVTVTVLISFHIYQYDLVLLQVPLLLVLNLALRGKVGKWPVLGFAALFYCTPFYIMGTLLICLNLLTVLIIAFALYLAWFTALPEQRALPTAAGGCS